MPPRGASGVRSREKLEGEAPRRQCLVRVGRRSSELGGGGVRAEKIETPSTPGSHRKSFERGGEGVRVEKISPPRLPAPIESIESLSRGKAKVSGGRKARTRRACGNTRSPSASRGEVKMSGGEKGSNGSTSHSRREFIGWGGGSIRGEKVEDSPTPDSPERSECEATRHFFKSSRCFRTARLKRRGTSDSPAFWKSFLARLFFLRRRRTRARL